LSFDIPCSIFDILCKPTSNIEQGIMNIEVKNGASNLFTDVGHQGHEAGPLNGVFDCSLECGAGAAPLLAVQLALAGAELFETLHVFVIHVSRSRAAFFGAEPAAVFPSSP
jgi:hypothetical protein